MHPTAFKAALAILVSAPALAQSPALPQRARASDAAQLSPPQQSIALTRSGEVQFSLGFEAGVLSRDSGLGSRERTQAAATIGFAYGLSGNTEVFGVLPLDRVESSDSLLGMTQRQTQWSGTASIGLRHVLHHETGSLPEIVASLSIGHPVGGTRGAEPNIRVGLAAYSVIDPVTLSFGLGLGTGLDTGATRLDLFAALDFAVTNRLSLGAVLSWTSDRADFGDARRQGAAMRFSVGIEAPSGASVLQPYVSIGLTDQAPDAAVGVAWVYRW